MKVPRFYLIIVLGLIAAASTFVVAGCGHGHSGESSGQKAEHSTQQEIEDNYAKDEPVPALKNSQVRQNLIEIEEAVAEGVQTTSFFFNLGVEDPIKSCPSIGVPIPATAELTNPEQVISQSSINSSGGNVTIPQMDPDGVYKGDTEGTFVLCINAKGEAYVDYWEGFVDAEFAPASWNRTNHEIEDTGSATWDFSEKTAPSGTDPEKQESKVE